MSYKAQSTKDEPMKLKLHLTDIQSIFTREDMLENMDRVVDAICAFYGDIPPEAFFLSPANGGWSPEKNLRHLLKSTQPIYLGLMSPKIALFIFGSAKEKSRTMLEIKNEYLTKLNTGSGAGVFTPIGENTKVDTEAQKKFIADFNKLFGKYKKQINSWEDSAMDKYNMPHPILGNLSIREMLLFSFFHLFHHTEKVEARLNAL